MKKLLVLAVIAVASVLALTSKESVSVVKKIDVESLLTKTKCSSPDSISYYYYPEPKPKVKNNKFGIYIYAEIADFFESAQNLVNSNGGDWGYALIPYNVGDNDYSKWSNAFERLRNKHLIPIIQLNAVNPDKYKEQTEDAADFLNEFVWPIKQRYISVYNEPNDAKFWYGKVRPSEYARILDYTIETFKDVNHDFFILNGALNVSASASAESMDAFDFMREMKREIPDIFDKLDGWASHSYPQPNFSGSPYTLGRLGIQAYESELAFLANSLGVIKKLPVFITETGWAHAEGESYNPSYLPIQAYSDIWLKDDRVMAVIPFTIWYQPPFDHFSWLNRDRAPYAHYLAVKDMKKIEGTPQHVEVGIIPLCLNQN